MVGARGGTRALVRRARAAGALPGLDAELIAIALSGGVSIERAPSPCVATRRARSRMPRPAAVLDLSRTAGVPAVELLRAAAATGTSPCSGRGTAAGGARCPLALLLPLGVCTLPAFLLLGVAPMLAERHRLVPAAVSDVAQCPCPPTVPTDRAHRP